MEIILTQKKINKILDDVKDRVKKHTKNFIEAMKNLERSI